MPDPTTYLHSLSHMAAFAEAPVAQVQKILDEIGARPSLVLNLCPYYPIGVLGVVIARAKGWTNTGMYYRDFHDEVRADG